MVFRAPPPRQPVTRIAWGPFPVRWARLAYAVLLGGVVGILPLLGARTLTTTLTRARDGRVTWRVVESGPILPAIRRTFPESEIVELRERAASGSRGNDSDTMETLLLDSSGNDHVVARRRVGEEPSRRLQSFLEDASPGEVTVVSSPGILPFLFAGALMLGGLGLAFHSLRGCGRLVVEIDPSNDLVRVRRSWLAPPSDVESVRLRDVEKVSLERGPVADALRLARQAPEQGGRLVLTCRDGRTLPLATRMLRGEAVHLRALAELATALEAEALDPGEVVAVAPPVVRRTSKPLVYIAGALALAGVVAATVVSNRTASSGGRVHIRAQVRCQFDGMDMLPGGEMATDLAPGAYPLRVFNPRVEGHWEDQEIVVREGMTLEVTCRPSNAE